MFLPRATAAGEAAFDRDHRMAYGCWTATATKSTVSSTGSPRIREGEQDHTYAVAATAGQFSERTW